MKPSEEIEHARTCWPASIWGVIFIQMILQANEGRQIIMQDVSKEWLDFLAESAPAAAGSRRGADDPRNSAEGGQKASDYTG